MNPYLLIFMIGISYIVVFGGLSLIRREGLSTQFAIEALAFTGLVTIGVWLTGTTIHPILFLAVMYLLSMRGRLLVDLANLLSNRGRQRDAMRLLELAQRTFPDRATRLVILVNMGIVQLRRKDLRGSQELFERVLQAAETGGLGIKYEAACRYNLGVTLQEQGKEAQAVHQYNEAISTLPSSIYARAASIALEKRRRRSNETDEKEG
jgi:tetratricopeptide (TPR) repeat protein